MFGSIQMRGMVSPRSALQVTIVTGRTFAWREPPRKVMAAKALVSLCLDVWEEAEGEMYGSEGRQDA